MAQVGGGLDLAQEALVADRPCAPLRGLPRRPLGSNPLCDLLRRPRGFERDAAFTERASVSRTGLMTEGVGFEPTRPLGRRFSSSPRRSASGCVELHTVAETGDSSRVPRHQSALSCVYSRRGVGKTLANLALSLANPEGLRPCCDSEDLLLFGP